jgi:hypothetical protein
MSEMWRRLRYLFNRRQYEQDLAHGDNGPQLAFHLLGVVFHVVHFALRFAPWQTQCLRAFQQ